MTTNTLSPVENIIAGVPYRLLCRWCRAGRITGAVKIGRRWFVRSDAAAPADADLIRDQLRALGYAA